MPVRVRRRGATAGADQRAHAGEEVQALSVITDPSVLGDSEILVGALRAELADLLGP